MAAIACTVAAGVLMVFTVAGKGIFQFLGFTMAAFQIAGSLLLMRIALDMLCAQRSRERETDEEIEAGAAKDDIAITPLGIPMLAGPGSISTSLILLGQARGVARHVKLFVCIGIVCFLSDVILRFGSHGMRRASLSRDDSVEHQPPRDLVLRRRGRTSLSCEARRAKKDGPRRTWRTKGMHRGAALQVQLNGHG